MRTRMRWMTAMMVAVCCGLAVGTIAEAAKFPEKPITLIVHSAAGGGSDIFARTLSAAFDKEKLLPQPIVVENSRAGAGPSPSRTWAPRRGIPISS